MFLHKLQDKLGEKMKNKQKKKSVKSTACFVLRQIIKYTGKNNEKIFKNS